jgi:hypothetical protein
VGRKYGQNQVSRIYGHDDAGDGPFLNPLFGDGVTPRRTAFTPQTNPVWSPHPAEDMDATMLSALPPPPASFLALSTQLAGK